MQLNDTESVTIPKELYGILIEIARDWIKNRNQTFNIVSSPSGTYGGYETRTVPFNANKVSDYPPTPAPTC